MRNGSRFTGTLAATLGIALLLAGCGGGNKAGEVVLLNASYDPTRELYKALNEAFAAEHEKKTGIPVRIKQSHGASGSQARAIIDGLEADVATLALWSDTEALHKKGLLAEGWEEKLPNRSLPYVSTIVFVVRKGNPKQIKDWPDLVKGEVAVITPNPRTSGNGKLAFLAAWGDAFQSGGGEDAAKTFVTELYRRVPVLDTGARGSTTTFLHKKIGDVHLTWENEAHYEVKEAAGELEIVYPPRSVLAEPHVALVDQNVDRKGTRATADAYLRFLYEPAGQEIIAAHYYRPTDKAALEKHRAHFPEMKLFSLKDLGLGWDAAQTKFFADGGVFDAIYQKAAKR
ncbi:MAG TPA: sulfate ABC transporter substrate-binding protein [Planctomycetia bacterium]|nr:sulfate ABC transporter substrate-binding protein [Planctomycetia bacterium]